MYHLLTKTIDRNVTVDNLLSLSFPLSEAVDFMETVKTFYIPLTQQVCKQPVSIPLPLTQHMDFYFKILTGINVPYFCYQYYSINYLLIENIKIFSQVL